MSEESINAERLNILAASSVDISKSLRSIEGTMATLCAKVDDLTRRIGAMETRTEKDDHQPGRSPACVEHKERLDQINARIVELEHRMYVWVGVSSVIMFIVGIVAPIAISHLLKKP